MSKSANDSEAINPVTTESEHNLPKSPDGDKGNNPLPSQSNNLEATTNIPKETESSAHGIGANHKTDVTSVVKRTNIIADFRRKLRDDAVYSENLRHSLCLALALFALGVTESQGGPTFLDLQIITDTDVGQASAFFTSHSCGYMLGSVASGYISGRKINASLTLLLSLLAMGIAGIVIPYCSLFGTMVAMRGLTGIFGGFIDTTANAEHMRIWGKDGHVLMQLLHFCFALGGVVSPLVTEPFLAKRKDDESANKRSNLPSHAGSTNLGHSNFSASDSIDIYGTNESYAPTYIKQPFNYTHNVSINANTEYPLELRESRETNVHWAFLITGTIVILTSIPFVFLYHKSKQKKSEAANEENEVDTGYNRKISLTAKVFLVIGLGAFYVFYCGVEDTFANFLMTFVVRRFETVSKSDGAHITAVYWSSFAASRFLMIFVSQALSPVRVLYVGGSLMLLSFTGFTISSGPWIGGSGSATWYKNDTVGVNNITGSINAVAGQVAGEDGGSVPLLTFFAALAALAMSGVFPAGLSWSGAELLKVTGRVSSCVFISASLGAMLNPLLVSRLMRDVSNMWFCYVLLLEVTGLVLVFCSLLAFNRCYLNKRYGNLHASNNVTVGAADINCHARQQMLDTRCEAEISQRDGADASENNSYTQVDTLC